jgi:hypothetical protein
MTFYFVRWPIADDADMRDQHLISSQCLDDWVSLDGPEEAKP